MIDVLDALWFWAAGSGRRSGLDDDAEWLYADVFFNSRWRGSRGGDWWLVFVGGWRIVPVGLDHDFGSSAAFEEAVFVGGR